MADRELITVDQLFSGEILKSYELLQSEYNLSGMDFFRFLQLCHYLPTHTDWEQLRKPPSNLENIFILAMKGVIKTNLTSHLYRWLQEMVTGNTWETKQKWELEMNICISDKTWKKACLEGQKLTSSPSLRKFEWKIRMRVFQTTTATPQNYVGENVARLGTILIFSGIVPNCPSIGEIFGQRLDKSWR